MIDYTERLSPDFGNLSNRNGWVSSKYLRKITENLYWIETCFIYICKNIIYIKLEYIFVVCNFYWQSRLNYAINKLFYLFQIFSVELWNWLACALQTKIFDMFSCNLAYLHVENRVEVFHRRYKSIHPDQDGVAQKKKWTHFFIELIRKKIVILVEASVLTPKKKDL